jgi:hypothetical protein
MCTVVPGLGRQQQASAGPGHRARGSPSTSPISGSAQPLLASVARAAPADSRYCKPHAWMRAAPPLVRSGPVDETLTPGYRRGVADRALGDLRHSVGRQRPGVGGRATRERRRRARPAAGIRRLRPRRRRPYPPGPREGLRGPSLLPVRRLAIEDPVTGSLNASLCQMAPANRPRRSSPHRQPRHSARTFGTRPHQPRRQRNHMDRRQHGRASVATSTL